MDKIEEIKSIKEIPEDFDYLLINEKIPITFYLDEWISMSFRIEASMLIKDLDESEQEIFEWFKVDLNKAIILAYNRYARIANYAKEMVDKGLWPDHSKTMQEGESNELG